MTVELKNLPYPEFFVDESIVKENDKIESRSDISFNKMERINTENELFKTEDYYNSSDALSLGNKTSGSNNFDSKTSDGERPNDNDSAPKKNKKKLIIAIVVILALVIIAVGLIIGFAPSSGGSETNETGQQGDGNEEDTFTGPYAINIDEGIDVVVDKHDPKKVPGQDKVPQPPKGGSGGTTPPLVDDEGSTRTKGDTSGKGTKDKGPVVPDHKSGGGAKEGTTTTTDTKKPETTDPTKQPTTDTTKPDEQEPPKAVSIDDKTPAGSIEEPPKAVSIDDKTPAGSIEEPPKVDPIEGKTPPESAVIVEKPENTEVTKDENTVGDSATLVRKHKYVLKQDPAEYNLNLNRALNPLSKSDLYDQQPRNKVKPEDIYDTKRDKFIYTKTYGNNFVQTKPFEFDYVEMKLGEKTIAVSKVKPSFNCAFYLGASKTTQIHRVAYSDDSILVENTEKLEYLTVWEENFSKIQLVTIVATPNTAGGINKEDRERTYIQYKIPAEGNGAKVPVVTQDAMNNTIQVLNSIFK